MRNADCVVCITTRRGRTWTYRKDNGVWTQTGPTGKVHQLTAEQLLSHLLPPLAAGDRSRLSVRVERIDREATMNAERRPNRPVSGTCR